VNSFRRAFLFAGLAFGSWSWAAAPSHRLAQNTAKDEKSIEEEIEDDHSGPEDLTPAPKPGGETPDTPWSEYSKKNDSPTESSKINDAPEVPEGPNRRVYQEQYKASSASGQPIFDWSKHRGEREVPHPFAEKGLIRITKNKDYYYKVKESDQNRAFDFKVGMFNPTNLQNPDTGVSFQDNYEQTQNPAIMFNYEWQLWQSPIGKWGLRAGTGFYVAQGHGHFDSAGPNKGLTPRENFTFALIPANVGAVYRLQLWHRQLFVPYAEGGGTLFGFTEFRDDNKPPKFGGSVGAYFAGGVAFNLTYFDALSRINLDREYGINTVYLTVEYRGVVAIMKRYDFTGDLFNAGFLMEY
jgi:hypothetical protein